MNQNLNGSPEARATSPLSTPLLGLAMLATMWSAPTQAQADSAIQSVMGGRASYDSMYRTTPQDMSRQISASVSLAFTTTSVVPIAQVAGIAHAAEERLAATPFSPPTAISNWAAQAGLADAQIGRLFGVTRQTAYNWRNGAVSPDAQTVDRLRAFDTLLAQIPDDRRWYLKTAMDIPTQDGLLLEDVLSAGGWADSGPERLGRVGSTILEVIGRLAAREERRNGARIEGEQLAQRIESNIVYKT